MSDLEYKLLAHFTDATKLAEAYDLGIGPEVFEEPICQKVFAFTVQYWLDSNMQLAPTRYVMEQHIPGFRLVEEGAHEIATSWLVEQLQKRYVTNQLQEMVREAAKDANEKPMETLRSLANLTHMASEAIVPRITRSNMSNIHERRLRYNERAQRPEGIGLTLGIPELDAHTGGLADGELAVVGAYSKVGKTMMLIKAAAELRKAGKTPIIFTLEMGLAEIEDRIDAMYSGISYNRFIKGQLEFDEAKRWHAAQEALRDTGGILVECPEEGDRTVSHLVNRARHAGADMVLIDQLSHMEPGRGVRDDTEHHSVVMKQLSTELSRPGKEIPCFLAVQFNRKSLEAKGGPSMDHFANAAAVEREVDLALGLYRSAEERRNRVMQLHILGARRSDTKDWVLKWDLIDRTLIEVLHT